MRQFIRRYYVAEIITVAVVALMVLAGFRSDAVHRQMMLDVQREMDQNARRVNAGTMHEDDVNYPSERQ